MKLLQSFPADASGPAAAKLARGARASEGPVATSGGGSANDQKRYNYTLYSYRVLKHQDTNTGTGKRTQTKTQTHAHSPHLDFSRIVGNSFALQHCTWLPSYPFGTAPDLTCSDHATVLARYLLH
jgi:hypothetical protein